MPRETEVVIFGVRHHGPGCARHLRAALGRLRPDCVLVEGPPEADRLLAFVARRELRPPIALLVYPEAAPGRGVAFPFAAFSPEWQALRYAASRKIPARFCDLPYARQLALPEEGPPRDPLAEIGVACGFEEDWWERAVEENPRGRGLFPALLEAMAELRREHGPPARRQLLREAAMRRVLRRARRDFHRIAVVCGAWHAPALRDLPPAAADQALLKGLPRVRVQATWTAWDAPQLARRSGYGAGVEAPGWSAHLFRTRRAPGPAWLSRLARGLRERGFPASPAGAIAALRLARALAALRGIPRPGRGELREAAETVLGDGDPRRLAVLRALEGGEGRGRVPADVPRLPLQREVYASLKRLRFGPRNRRLDLDLRKPRQREKSALLARLQLLGVPWGTRLPRRGTGTFKERWQLAWRPDFDLRLREAGRHGGTLEAAAAAALREQTWEAARLPALVALLETCLQADLPAALPDLLRALRDRTAVAPDLVELMRALPPLARLLRYGDVRLPAEVAARRIGPLFREVFARLCVALPTALRGRAPAAARELLAGIRAVRDAVRLGEGASAALLVRWRGLLAARLRDRQLPALLRGGFCRLLLEDGELSAAALGALVALHLRPEAAEEAAAWSEGLLADGELLLPDLAPLWEALDRWLQALPEAEFLAVLPLLRRAFAAFPPAARRGIAARLREPGPAPLPPAPHPARAALLEPVLRLLLGGDDG